jgi:hypothetical protein
MDTGTQAQGIDGCLGNNAIQMVARADSRSQACGGNVLSIHYGGKGGIPVMRDPIHLSWIKREGIMAFDESV